MRVFSGRNFIPGRSAPWPFIALVLALLTVHDHALADLGCRAEVNRNTVAQGEIVVLTVTAEGDADWSAEFELPPLPDVQVSGGGTNQSMSFVNGRRSASVAKTYYLRVDREQDFTIGPIRIISSGKECLTEPIEIRVTKSSATHSVPPSDSGNRVASPAKRPASGPSRQEGLSNAGQSGDDVFVTLEADRTTVWVGQQVILRFRYYRRIQPWNNPKYIAPRTEGFWREDLGPESNFRKVVAGRAYNVTEIRYAIFPTHSGDLSVGPAELQFPDDVFDRFFSSRRHRGPRVLTTGPVVIKVKDLPSPAPEGFSGLVASRLDLVAEVDRDTVPRGEPVGLRVQLDCDGFLKGFKGLAVSEPEGSRMHHAGEHFSSGPNNNRLLGSVVVEKVIVPSEDGTLTLDPVELSWFDGMQGRYRTARTRSHVLTVTPSDLPTGMEDDSGFLRNEIARLGQDLAFIHRGGEKLRIRSAPMVYSVFWWVLLVMPVVLLALWRFHISRQSADLRDPAGRRQRRALSMARKELKRASSIGGQMEQLDAVARIVTRFVADCTGAPVASIASIEVRSFCSALEAFEASDRLVQFLVEADQMRYGREDFLAAENMIESVEGILTDLYSRHRKVHPGQGAGGLLAGSLMFLFLLAVPPTTLAQASENPAPGIDPARLLAEGNQAYTEGKLDLAMDLYLRVKEEGVDDPDLHFNLGNTHARRGELGKAIASYLRARRLSPRDGDVSENLAWVRGHIQDLELSTGQLPLFIDQCSSLIGSLSLDEWSLLLVILVWVLAGLAGWAFYRDDFGTHLRRALLGLGGLVLLTAIVVAWRFQREEIHREAVIIVAEAAVRSGPAESFPVLFQIHDGLTMMIESEREDWCRIGLGGAWVGWVHSESLEEVRLNRSRGEDTSSQSR
ncbi:MAG: BatD family protein [Gemmatimonadales bacterium]|nr:BatD family protein [Gemmatimonadales bacterium]